MAPAGSKRRCGHLFLAAAAFLWAPGELSSHLSAESRAPAHLSPHVGQGPELDRWSPVLEGGPRSAALEGCTVPLLCIPVGIYIREVPALLV